MKFRFYAEDFKSPKAHIICLKDIRAAELANKKLEAYLATLEETSLDDDGKNVDCLLWPVKGHNRRGVEPS